MPITVLTTFKIDRDAGLRLAGEAAPVLKRHGATGVRVGFCHAGPRTGTMTVVTMFQDWSSYGKGVQGMYDDPAYQHILAEGSKLGELLDRSIMVMQDL